jgi:hypothetical protein
MKGPGKPRCLILLAATSLITAGGASAQELAGDVLIGVSRSHYLAEALRAAPSGGIDQWVRVRSGSRIAPTLGVGVSAPLARLLSLRGELLVVRKGLSSASVVLDEIYLEIPLLLEFEMTWKGPVRFRAVAGVAPSRELRCSAKVAPPVADLSGSGDPRLVPADCDDFRTESGDIGNVFGAGFGPFRVAGLALMPELRLVLGGADLIAERNRERARHRTLSLLVGVTR